MERRALRFLRFLRFEALTSHEDPVQIALSVLCQFLTCLPYFHHGFQWPKKRPSLVMLMVHHLVKFSWKAQGFQKTIDRSEHQAAPATIPFPLGYGSQSQVIGYPKRRLGRLWSYQSPPSRLWPRYVVTGIDHFPNPRSFKIYTAGHFEAYISHIQNIHIYNIILYNHT